MGLVEIAGYYSNLKKGFMELGYKSLFITKEKHKFDFGGDDNNCNIIVNAFSYFGFKRKSIPRKKFMAKGLFILLHWIFSIFTLCWAIFKFDVFIFGFGSTFLGYKELPLLKMFGKKIIYVFHGSDTRPPYINGAYSNCESSELVKLSLRIKSILSKIERYADHIICNPPQAQLHERPFISRMYVGSPIYINKSNITKYDSKSIRIMHSPSDAKKKGTESIRDIMKNIKRMYPNINYIETSNLPNEIIIEEMIKSDIIIDQLYSDFPMTGIAREAAFLGKPVVSGGYYAEEISKDYSDSIPIYYCHPDKMKQAIIDLVESADLREKVGRSAKEYINIHGAPVEVAKRYIQIILGKAPRDWYYSPYDITYIKGCGFEENLLQQTLSKLIMEEGIGSLQLSDKPQLEERFLEFIDGID